jgi:hypothetical protein
MALKNLKSKLTELRYGKDKQGGGDSGLPYIQTALPGDQTGGIAKYGYDFPIRGGLTSISDSLVDVVRIGKFLADAPRGPLFVLKQVGLQLTNPRTETGEGIGPFKNTQVYNLGVNTLAQVGVNAAGIHFNRAGLTPLGGKFYTDIVNAHQDVSTNRLNALYRTKIANLSVNPAVVLDKGISTNPLQILEYIGGPGSFLGIGKTTINRYTNTVSIGSSENIDYGHGVNRFATFTRKNLEDTQAKIKNFAQIGDDFRKVLSTKDTNTFLTFSDYAKFNIDTRIGTGNPGNPKRDRSSYTKSDTSTQDKINMLPLMNVIGGAYEKTGKIEDQILGRDLIKFRFEAINNDSPSLGIGMIFRAFLSSFSDNFAPELNSYKYIGRGETFYTSQGFTRSISLSFKISAQSRDEMKPLYQKLNYLMSNTTPDYKNTYMRGSMIKLTVGDYIFAQPGYISSLNIDISNDYSWEIALDEPENGGSNNGSNDNDNKVYELPHTLDVSLTFIPIHDFLPKKSSELPFITPNKKDNGWLAKVKSTHIIK